MRRRDIENRKEKMQREKEREKKINSTIILALKPVYCINGPNR
jgi:hypothetical protein